MKNISVYLLVTGLCIGLWSCGGPKQQAEGNQTVRNHPAILEMISADTSEKVSRQLKSFLREGDELMRWKNHYLVYSASGELHIFKNSLKAAYPEMAVKAYPTDSMYYRFDRSHCADSSVAKEWKNIILTANMVADTSLQREYLQYHKTQFAEWPEISQGFCNAEFQQLVMFKNGRQLMLVISIPKGKTLDELNPKTTENNPKVDEWNQIMAKYQEGIEGTQEGETWVFFK